MRISRTITFRTLCGLLLAALLCASCGEDPATPHASELDSGTADTVEEGCTDTCRSADQRRCESGAVVTCDDHDGDGCREWGSPRECSQGRICDVRLCEDGCCLPLCPDNASDGPGSLRWHLRFGQAAQSYSNSVAVDAEGNMVITGMFEGRVNFGGDRLESLGATDIFLAKFDASGDHLWSKQLGGQGKAAARSLAVDQAGNIVVTGDFEQSVDFGGGTLTSTGKYDIFVAKFDSTGAHVWSKRFGDTEGDSGGGIGLDRDGNVYLTGSFEGDVDFGGGVLTSAAGSDDLFVAKFDPSGTHLWSQHFGGKYTDSGMDMALDAQGNLILTGAFRGHTDFGGGKLTSAGSLDAFVAKFDPSGAHLWSQRYGNFGWDDGAGVTADANGDIYMTGQFLGAVDFGGGPLQSRGEISEGSTGFPLESDIFLIKLDSEGNHLWSQRFGGASWDAGKSVAVDQTGHVVMTGAFTMHADFGACTLASSGYTDLIVAKLAPSGDLVWRQQLGDSETADAGLDAAVDPSGNVLVTGVQASEYLFGFVTFGEIVLAKLAP